MSVLDLLIALVVLGFVGVFAGIVVWAVVTYNKLVRRRNQIDAAWGQVDVQLVRRQDLIPNLVETVKGYAGHEQGTLQSVIAARQQAVAATGPAQQAQAENMLTGALRQLFAVAEAYPQLKANQNFASLQDELGRTEDKTAYARQFYNDAVLTYNNAVQSLPSSVIAGVGGFRVRDYFKAGESERAAPQVRF